MRECFHCKQKGDIRDVQPFYCQYDGRGGNVWLHAGECSRAYNAKLRAKEAALGTQQATSKPEQP